VAVQVAVQTQLQQQDQHCFQQRKEKMAVQEQLAQWVHQDMAVAGAQEQSAEMRWELQLVAQGEQAQLTQ
jgi:hypothetical protein